ncbi:MAG: TauD/TfdA family dioxygenase [Microcoleus sp. SIO2G3]|nr:TauD/TfdA family dioxygenase [Microcoleus sp. SIO2G3]
MEVIAPETDQIGFEIFDVDVASIAERRGNGIAPQTLESIKQLIYRHKLIVFRNQKITPDQYVEFAKQLGTPQIYFQDNYHHPDYPEIFVSANVLIDGQKIGVSGTGRYWHTDCAFQPEPLPLTMLYPQVLPRSIRETYYIDMHRVYKNLPPDLRQYVEGQEALHEAKWRYKVQAWDIDRAMIDILNDFEKQAPPVTHPAVITHPVTQQRSLYINQGFTTKIAGLNYEDSKEVLGKLFAFIERDEHIHTHVWQEGDILLWDNRPLLHKASSVPQGEPSISYRIGIYDGLPFYVA